MTLVAKVDGHPLAVAGQLREALRGVDRNLPVSEIKTMESVTAEALAQPRFVTLLLAVFAATAMMLASIGIYGTISLLVTERTQEMGIRLALGADPRAILTLVLTQGAALTTAGLVLGLTAAAALSRTLSGMVYGIATLDPPTFIAVPALLCAVALTACLVPARRAAAVDPITTLRQG